MNPKNKKPTSMGSKKHAFPNLPDKELLIRLFGREDIRPPFKQERWRPRPQKLPIDQIIGKLTKPRSRGVRIKERARFGVEFCPYYDTRLFLRSIVYIASMQQHSATEADHYAARLKKMKKDGDAIVDRLRNFIGENPTYPLIHMDDVGDVNGLYRISFDYQGAAAEHKRFQDATRKLMDAANLFRNELDAQASKKMMRLRPPHRRGDVWRETFVECLGRYFYFLTGSLPTLHNSFLPFANLAYKTVTNNKTSLKSQVERVIKRINSMPTWARFDRDEDRRPSLANLASASAERTTPRTAEWREWWQLVIRLSARGHLGAKAALSRGMEFEGKALQGLISEEANAAAQ